ncbi:MAG: hypothetical protein A3G34_15645 [Candidatus Lindowbacteria bacterium RIFCSPLOWO2_12_FULL_62_27]|nr:MAG: hypothetical protein A3G34_15645 [Candidatus Lindowbacteria bacterium RIFCSPLOWO2_12_FULL_62_27]
MKIARTFAVGAAVAFGAMVAWAGDVSWEQCAREARARHPDLRAAEASVRSAAAAVGSGRAEYWPDLDGGVDYSRSHSSASGDQYAYSLSASQRLFPGLTDQPEVAKAKAALDAARADLASTSADVQIDLRSAFARLLHAQEFLTLAEKIADRRKQNVDLVRARFDAGREHKGSFLRAKAQAHEADFDVRQARRAVRVAQQELRRALGGRDDGEVRAVGGLEAGVPPEEPDFAALADRTPAVRKSVADRRAGELGVTIERRNFYPTLSLSGSAKRSDGRWPPRRTTGDWSGGLALSLPLFSGGKEWRDVESARADAERLAFVEESARNFASLDLRDRHAGFVDAAEFVAVREEFLEAARVRAEIAQAQYASGLLTYQDWDIIENDLISQERAALAARRDAVLAEAEWLNATGKELEP